MKFYRAEMKNLESGVGVAWNCPFLPGAGAAFFAWSGVGSGTLYVRSRPNKWRFRNTALNRVNPNKMGIGEKSSTFIQNNFTP